MGPIGVGYAMARFARPDRRPERAGAGPDPPARLPGKSGSAEEAHMAYGVLWGAAALTVVGAIRALLPRRERRRGALSPCGRSAPPGARRSRPGGDEQGVEKSTDPDERVPGDNDARVQRTPRTERRASGADLDRKNPEFSRALDLMRAETASPEGGHVFITGKAGTGKSTLIKHFLETAVTASTVVLAPTGVAALNVQGQTVYRFFNFWIDVTPEKVRKSGKPKRRSCTRSCRPSSSMRHRCCGRICSIV